MYSVLEAQVLVYAYDGVGDVVDAGFYFLLLCGRILLLGQFFDLFDQLFHLGAVCLFGQH